MNGYSSGKKIELHGMTLIKFCKPSLSNIRMSPCFSKELGFLPLRICSRDEFGV